MTKEVLVTISGLQMAVDELDNEDGPIEVITPGTYYFKDDTHYIFISQNASKLKYFPQILDKRPSVFFLFHLQNRR